MAGKRVEWKAKFDRPIEELIYPSLQRFDIAGYEKRVQQRQRGDKLNDHHGSAKTPSMIKYFNNHETDGQIKLEPIPAHLLPANEEIVYVHTPQWTVKLGDSVKPRTPVAADSTEQVKFASISEEIDIEGERYLRERMRASIAEREEEKRRKEKLAMGFLLGLNRRVAVDLQPVSLDPQDNAKVLVRLLCMRRPHLKYTCGMRMFCVIAAWTLFSFVFLALQVQLSCPDFCCVFGCSRVSVCESGEARQRAPGESEAERPRREQHI